jgi:hypothetical protein
MVKNEGYLLKLTGDKSAPVYSCFGNFQLEIPFFDRMFHFSQLEIPFFNRTKNAPVYFVKGNIDISIIEV